tara:strand:+ start:4069 stop:4554 length:486 start_codon:yes stop_codon:yes gene_type:complete
MKKYNYYYILLILLLIIIFNTFLFSSIEEFKTSSFRSSKTSTTNKKTKICRRPATCPNQKTLYKCLNKNEIETNNNFHIAKICRDFTKHKYQTQANKNIKNVKCKINDECGDNNLISYTCVDRNDHDKIKTNKDNGWADGIDREYHKECEPTLAETYCTVM